MRSRRNGSTAFSESTSPGRQASRLISRPANWGAAGILIGFAPEEDWFDYRLEHHPEFLRRIAEARAAIREGRGTRLAAIE
jgi:hypothetical protein